MWIQVLPSPCHKYPDRNTDWTEIFTTFLRAGMLNYDVEQVTARAHAIAWEPSQEAGACSIKLVQGTSVMVPSSPSPPTSLPAGSRGTSNLHNSVAVSYNRVCRPNLARCAPQCFLLHHACQELSKCSRVRVRDPGIVHNQN